MLQTALNAAAFLDSIGVNTHLAWTNTPYGDVGQVAAELAYVGIHNLRDSIGNPDAEGALMALGDRFDLFSPGVDPTRFLSIARGLAAGYPGAVIALEGPNEVDAAPISFNGLTGWPAAIAYQQALYAAAKADPVLASVPVYNLTVSAVNVSGALGDLAASADFANDHIYFGGGMPAYGSNPGDPTFYWTSWLASGQLDAPGRPSVVTETGATATPTWGGGVDENVQARQILDALMDAAKTGVAATYLYELVDSANNGPNDPQSHYGLFRWDGSARPAAVAVHDFMQILGGQTSASYATGALDYAIQGVPQWGGQLLFQKANGVQDIVVWAEPTIWNIHTHSEIAPPDTPITITFASPEIVALFDPLQGATAVQALGGTTSVTFDVTDHPLIVKVTPATGAGAVLVAANAQGGPGADTITGACAGGVLLGGGGDDSITAGSGLSQLSGERGNDTLVGGAGPDTMHGGQGDDLIRAGAGNDWLSGDLGDNTLYGDQGQDTFHAGAGHDTVIGWSPEDHVQVDPGVTWTLAQGAGEVVVRLSNGGEMDLMNVQLGSLPSGWIFSA